MSAGGAASASLGDRYRLLRELGSGATATVYQARDLKHDRDVAVKVLHPHLAAVVGGERFLREVRLTASLDHPHILTLIDSGVEEGRPFLVLPLVRGESLRARLERERQLPIADAVAIAQQLAGALAHAHARGIVHRDIKPENILLHEGEAVLTDFGIALAVTEAGGSRLTETGLSIGTPQYMSPEQATGDRQVDHRSDIYSLGAVTYEMLAGEPPFSGHSTQAIVAKLLTERPVGLRVLRGAVSPHLQAAVSRSLEKVAADRFATAEEFSAALGTSGTGPWLRERGEIPTRRRALAWGAVGLSIVLLSVLGRAMLGGIRAEDAPAAAVLDPRRIAVLPFGVDGQAALAPIADGIAQNLIRELASGKGLQVISWNGVAGLRRAPLGPDSLQRTFNVGSVVEGRVWRSRTHLKVTVSLVDASDATIVESRTFDAAEEDLLQLRDSVVRGVAEFLRRRLGEEIRVASERSRATSERAWRLVQSARATVVLFDSLLESGDTTLARRELAQADTMLRTAAELDPMWATPRTERGWLAWRSRYLSGPLEARTTAQWTDQALRFAAEALQVDSQSADALTLRGTARYFRNVANVGASASAVRASGDSAEADLLAATLQDPSQAYAWSLLSHRLMRTGRPAEGKLAAMRAYEADPFLADAATILWRLYSASLDLRDRAESARWCAEGASRFPKDPVFVECRISLHTLEGSTPDIPQLWRLVDEYVALHREVQRPFRLRRAQMILAMALQASGHPDSARAVAVRARADGIIDPTRDLVFIEMLLRSRLGDQEEWLKLAAEYYAANPQERRLCPPIAPPATSTPSRPGAVADPRVRAIVCRDQ